MKRSPILALALLVLGASAASARQTQLGVDVAMLGLFPVGRYDSIAGPGIGVLAGVEAEAFPGLAATVRSGYVVHMERKSLSREMIPVLGGVKLTSYSSSFYAAGEAGIARTTLKDTRIEDSPGSTRTTTAWGIGVGSAAERLDLRLSLHVWDAARPRESATIGVSLGFLLIGY